MAERKKLVDTLETSYGSNDKGQEASISTAQETNQNGSPEQNAEKPSVPSPKKTSGKGSVKKLQKKSSLDKVDEDAESTTPVCKDFSYGVKSYLHHFYDSQHSYKDPNIYEEDDYYYLLGPRKRRICNSLWWKVTMWIGANFLVFGIVGVLVGYLVPPRPIIVGASDDNFEIKDTNAAIYNNNLDICKLVGLVLFCVGGICLSLALLCPTLFYKHCGDEDVDGGLVRVNTKTTDINSPGSPLEKSIPSLSQVTTVQPERNNQEAILTKEGMIPYSE